MSGRDVWYAEIIVVHKCVPTAYIFIERLSTFNAERLRVTESIAISQRIGSDRFGRISRLFTVSMDWTFVFLNREAFA